MEQRARGREAEHQRRRKKKEKKEKLAPLVGPRAAKNLALLFGSSLGFQSSPDAECQTTPSNDSFAPGKMDEGAEVVFCFGL